MKTLTMGIAETFLGEYAYNYGGYDGVCRRRFGADRDHVHLLAEVHDHRLTAGAVKG
jgi:hypothetical protein